jgi:hypothetical protein
MRCPSWSDAPCVHASSISGQVRPPSRNTVDRGDLPSNCFHASITSRPSYVSYMTLAIGMVYAKRFNKKAHL